MRLKSIHQFHPSCAVGDGVTNGMLFTRRLLRALGFESEIYCDHIPAALRNTVYPRNELRWSDDSLLFLHHSLGYKDDGWLATFSGQIVLVYHNITPEHLLPEEGPWRDLARLGRSQLTTWRPLILGALGVSPLNTEELRKAGYTDLRTIPLLVDLDKILAAPWEPRVLERYLDTTNILFVGRLAPNKRQDRLIAAFAEYLHYADEPARLILPGQAISEAYLQSLKDQALALGILDRIDFLGSVPDATLYSLYRAADLFVCLSEHEGFGMPLVEASFFDIPIVAYAAGNVPATLGEGGLIIDTCEPASLGALMHLVLSQKEVRRRILAGQQANLQHFHPEKIRTELAGFLEGLGIALSHPEGSATVAPEVKAITIEGPFDSSYSLAIVNRELARALEARGQTVALTITPGSDEPEPDGMFLRANPDIAAMADRGRRQDQLGATLRFTYPPRTDAMRGQVRAVHSYGWEETGFPARYVDWFNRKLDLVTVLSQQVKKILRDAGVRVPIEVVGGGVDQLASLPASPPRVLLKKSFRFLHISSCFPRKGVDALLAAYGQAFRATDDVTLVIKTFPNPHNDIPEQLATLQAKDPDYPDVVLIVEDWPEADLANLYRVCHAFVAPARGEGLALPLAEAMQFGLPVITTAWGGQTDFCTTETAWLCDYRFAPAGSHLKVEHSAWAEPDVAHLARLLIEVRQASPEDLAPRLAAAKDLVGREYTWARVAEKTEQALEKLASAPLFALEPTIGWVSTWNARCGIATYTGYLSAAIPRDRLRLFANRISEPLSPDGDNVLRCWDADVHGSINDLLAAITSTDISVLVIQYNFGFFSVASLAELIEAASVRGIQTHLFLHATKDVEKPDLRTSLSSIGAALAKVTRIYVHSVDDLNRLKCFGHVNNTVLFPHGVPAVSGTPDEKIRAYRGLTGKRAIASYGFLLPHKGFTELVEAFSILAKDMPDLHLILCCSLFPATESLEEKNRIEALVRTKKLAGRVTLINDFLPDEESLSWLQMADLIVFPYQNTQESASGAVRMGIASGKPVAVTPIPIFDDLGENVHRLPGSSVEQMAKGIGTLLTKPKLLESRQESCTRYREARTWPAVARRLLNIIDGLALECEGNHRP